MNLSLLDNRGDTDPDTTCCKITGWRATREEGSEAVAISFFCMCTSSFPNTVYWRDCLFLIEYCLLPCQMLTDGICMSLFLDFISEIEVYSPTNFQVYNTLLLTIGTILSVRSPVNYSSYKWNFMPFTNVLQFLLHRSFTFWLNFS